MGLLAEAVCQPACPGRYLCPWGAHAARMHHGHGRHRATTYALVVGSEPRSAIDPREPNWLAARDSIVVEAGMDAMGWRGGGGNVSVSRGGGRAGGEGLEEEEEVKEKAVVVVVVGAVAAAAAAVVVGVQGRRPTKKLVEAVAVVMLQRVWRRDRHQPQTSATDISHIYQPLLQTTSHSLPAPHSQGCVMRNPYLRGAPGE